MNTFLVKVEEAILIHEEKEISSGFLVSSSPRYEQLLKVTFIYPPTPSLSAYDDKAHTELDNLKNKLQISKEQIWEWIK